MQRTRYPTIQDNNHDRSTFLQAVGQWSFVVEVCIIYIYVYVINNDPCHSMSYGNLRWLVVTTIWRWGIIQGLLTTFRCRRGIIRRHFDGRKKKWEARCYRICSWLPFYIMLNQCLCVHSGVGTSGGEAFVVSNHPIYRVGAPLFRGHSRQSPSTKLGIVPHKQELLPFLLCKAFMFMDVSKKAIRAHYFNGISGIKSALMWNAECRWR